MDISKITDAEAKRFIKIFFVYRTINREFYELISESQFDYRMVDTQQRKSDTPRESLAHQINVEIEYLSNINSGDGSFGKNYDKTLKMKSKAELLKLLNEVDQNLVTFLAQKNNLSKKVIVKWSKTPISAITYLWAMNDHEILHQGWNLAIMDHLNIPRFPKLKAMWGD